MSDGYSGFLITITANYQNASTSSGIGEVEIWEICTYDGDEDYQSDWTKISPVDVPIATTSVAGIVKPDGASIKVDANGTIRDYGNSLEEETEYLNKAHIGQFSSGWHIIKNTSTNLDYTEFPIPKTMIGTAYLHVINGKDLNAPTGHSGFFYFSAVFISSQKMWVLPLWDWDDTNYPTSSDWVRIDNVLHKPESQYANGVIPAWNNGELGSAGLDTDDLITTSNSRKVVISSTAPSDTTALWVK